MLFGIVCTAGLGLIPFFLVAWGIGTIIMAIVDAVRGTQRQPALAGHTATKGQKVGRDQRALSSYMFQAKTVGMSYSEIKEKLKNQGWSDEQIKAALK